MAGIIAGAPIAMLGARPAAGASAVFTADQSMAVPHRMFISGHSLTNEPFPSDLAGIAAGFGLPFSWNRQHLEGSSIKQRSRGTASAGAPWAGYRAGIDRDNRPIDVLKTFRSEQEPSFDTLLITEQHSLLGSLVWNETPLHLRDFQDRFIAYNPKGRTYFFEPWLSLNDKDDPRRWIAYERAAAPVWRCVVGQMNETLAAEGRNDRIVSLPAALALAQLIERATQGSGMPGITQTSVRATIDSLVADDVHLTPLGNYYIALVTFAWTFRHPVEGAWHPASITLEQARALQAVAEDVVKQAQPPVLSIQDCRAYVLRSFMWTYLGYSDLTHWRKERGYMGSLFFRLKLAVQWWLLFNGDTPQNPFAPAAYARR